MFSVLLAVTVVLWFVLLYPFAARRLAVDVPPGNEPPVVPFVLIALFSFTLLVFNVQREDGSAILQDGLSASNIVMVVIAGVSGIYLAARVAMRRSLLLLPFSPTYLPFTLMVLFDGLSACWSIVPTYTAYRATELVIFTLMTIVLFDRDDVAKRFPVILACYIIAWLIAVIPTMAGNLAAGIVFSAAKNNLTPLVCAALMFLVLFKPPSAFRRSLFALGLIGFVVAGSAASTGAMLAALGPACLIASRRPSFRAIGWAAAAFAVLVFVFLIVGLSAAPGLVDVLSGLLQKPAEELENATGRTTFWPAFIAATRDHVIGSGYSAGDRFLQLLIPTSDLADSLGRDKIHISSSHNMFLSAWAGTGVAGLAFAVVVLGNAVARGLHLDRGDRRFVVALVLMLVLNGMTTPGIFQDWGNNTFVFVAMLSYIRIGLRQAREARTAATAGLSFGSRPRPTQLRPA